MPCRTMAGLLAAGNNASRREHRRSRTCRFVRSPPALDACRPKSYPLPCQHVIEIFGDDEDRLLPKTSCPVMCIRQPNIGGEEIRGVYEIGLVDLSTQNGANAWPLPAITERC